MTDFDIREAVRAVIDETDLTAPEDIAAKVAESVPARQMRSALTFVLVDYVRHELGRVRRDAEADMRTTPISAKRAAIAQYAQRWLRQRVVIDQQWKPIGDCTQEDCLALAEERRRHAQQNAAAALLWEARAALLVRHRAARLADLPADVLIEAEGREAA